MFTCILHAIRIHHTRLTVVQRFRTPAGATFKAHWRDLHHRQFNSAMQGLDRGYVTTPQDVWLDLWGLTEHEGRMRKTWRALMRDVLPSHVYDTLDDLTALETERRHRWLRPGGYFYEAVSKRRENALRLRYPRPWHLNQAKGRSVSGRILAERRKRANRRKPRMWQLRKSIETAKRDLRFLVQWWLDSTDLSCTFSVLEATILTMTGAILGRMEREPHSIREYALYFLRGKKKRRKRSFVTAPRVRLRDPMRFQPIRVRRSPTMLFLPSELRERVKAFNVRASVCIHSLWAAMTLGDRLRKLHEYGILFHPEDAPSAVIEPAMDWGWISRFAAMVSVTPARPNSSNHAVYPPSLTERYGAVEAMGSAVVREEVRDPWGTLVYRVGTEVEICGKIGRVWVVRDVGDVRENVQMVAQHLCR